MTTSMKIFEYGIGYTLNIKFLSKRLSLIAANDPLM